MQIENNKNGHFYTQSFRCSLYVHRMYVGNKCRFIHQPDLEHKGLVNIEEGFSRIIPNQTVSLVKPTTPPSNPSNHKGVG